MGESALLCRLKLDLVFRCQDESHVIVVKINCVVLKIDQAMDELFEAVGSMNDLILLRAGGKVALEL